jgi:hypothetical protein
VRPLQVRWLDGAGNDASAERWIAIVHHADSAMLFDDRDRAFWGGSPAKTRAHAAASLRKFSRLKMISTDYGSRMPGDYCDFGMFARR